MISTICACLLSSQLLRVASRSIAAIGYDLESATLRLVFCKGQVYDYYEVPPVIVSQFRAAPSKGRYYSNFIKGHFNRQRIQ
ncbi:MAG: KTSC domain-containing protein [Oribacterium sinus]|uniref:KTSC domain-containing protein n=1 Tax=Oribacterium sinus TaxID=237576 RepID=A0A930DZ98_9FIRM|nr:KTSC domain-containing protein [Oribacterium sinus]